MKKVIKLTESDLIRIIKKVIKEDSRYFDSEDTTFGSSEDVLHIPDLRRFDNVHYLFDYLRSNNIKRWSFGGSLELNGTGEKWTSVDLSENDLQLLQGLVKIDGYLDFSDNYDVRSLGSLQWVGNHLDLSGTNVKTLGNLRYVGGVLSLGSSVESLGQLEYVGFNAILTDSKVKSLGNLKVVNDGLYLEGTEIQSFGKLESVGELHLNRYLRTHYTDDEIMSMIDVKSRIYPTMD